MTVKEYVVVSIVMCIMVYLTATVTDRRHEQALSTAVSNAIATFEPSPLNCKEDNMIKGIRKLAENGAHMDDYSVWVYWTNGEVAQ